VCFLATVSSFCLPNFMHIGACMLKLQVNDKVGRLFFGTVCMLRCKSALHIYFNGHSSRLILNKKLLISFTCRFLNFSVTISTRCFMSKRIFKRLPLYHCRKTSLFT